MSNPATITTAAIRPPFRAQLTPGGSTGNNTVNLPLNPSTAPLSSSPGPVLALFIPPEFDQLPNNAVIALTGRLDTIQLRLSL